MLRKNSHLVKCIQNEHMRNIYSEAERRQGSYEFFRNNPEKPLPFDIFRCRKHGGGHRQAGYRRIVHKQSVGFPAFFADNICSEKHQGGSENTRHINKYTRLFGIILVFYKPSHKDKYHIARYYNRSQSTVYGNYKSVDERQDRIEHKAENAHILYGFDVFLIRGERKQRQAHIYGKNAIEKPKYIICLVIEYRKKKPLCAHGRGCLL